MQAKQKAIILEQIKNINTLYDVSFLDISKIASEHSEKMLESILIDMKIKQNGLTTLSKDLLIFLPSSAKTIP